MRFFLFLLAIVVISDARENPFAPVVKEISMKSVEAQTPNLTSMPIVEEDDVFKNALSGAVKNLRYVKLFAKQRQLHIRTKDTMLKHYSIVNPTRILIDFDSKRDLGSRKTGFTVDPIKEVRMGAHHGFYRMVIELTTKNKSYAIKKTSYGYVVTF